MATRALINQSAYVRGNVLKQATGLSMASVPSYHRRIHTKPPHQILAQAIAPGSSEQALKSLSSITESIVPGLPQRSATSHLSFLALLQTYLVTACTSSPLIIGSSIRVLSAIAYSTSAVLSPDRNPLLHWLLKHTIYRQFCAGENAAEVRATIARLQSTGIRGIILCYAREVELRGEENGTATMQDSEAQANQEIESWAQGVLKTVQMVPKGNFVSIKFSGAGSLTLQHLRNNLPPPPLLAKHLHSICTLAQSRGIKLCIDAEQSTFQAGIDTWTLDLQREFNSAPKNPSSSSSLTPTSNSAPSNSKPWACIFNTYQTYLLSSPSTLAAHLHLAAKENFVPGIKLVRGAYLGSEARSLFWPTKAATDSCFDSLARGLITQNWDDIISPSTTSTNTSTSMGTNKPLSQVAFPETSLVLATHNLQSARKALALRREQAETNQPRIEMVYAQLQGMADHVTGELVAAAAAAEAAATNTPVDAHCTSPSPSSPSSSLSELSTASSAALTSASTLTSGSASGLPADSPDAIPDPDPLVCKYLTWGTVGECAKYLVRRAEENRDAVARTVEARRALGAEIWRRVWAWV